MALLDLSLVTQSLVRLLKEHIRASPAWSANTEPKISPLPHDRLSDDSLGLYLIHVLEDPHFKNPPPTGLGSPPVRFSPLALSLIYQLTPHLGQDSAPGVYTSQLLFGLGMKALHDYPVIDDRTQLVTRDGTPLDIFLAELQGHGNTLRISLLPIPHAEAMSLWTGQAGAPRLSAYYEVQVVMLEPERKQVQPRRVLGFGVQLAPGAAPSIDTTRSVLTYALPGEPPRTVELQPAQAPAGDPVQGRVAFLGQGLSGDHTTLLLRGLQWTDEVETGWPLDPSAEKVVAVVQETAGGRRVVPGIYSARLAVSRRQVLSDGSSSEVLRTSNAAPFTVSPRIDSVTLAGGIYTVSGFLFSDPDLPEDALQVHLGDQQLTRVSTAPDAGAFRVSAPGTLQLRPPAGLPFGPASLRVLVRGAESLPLWIVLP